MPRLLYLVNIPRFFVTHRLPLAQAARDVGYDVQVATSVYDKENVERIRAAGFPFHPLPLRQHSTHSLHELAALSSIIRLYRDLKPDIVHQVTIKSVLYGGLAARVTGVPAVVNAITGLGYVFVAPGIKAAAIRSGATLAYRLLLRHPNARTIFQNPDDRDRFVGRGLLDSDRAVVIKGSGVDVNVFQPQPEPDGTPIVLFAGRLLWQKGVGEFVEAARRLKAMGVAACFVIAGIGETSNPAAVSPDRLEEWQRSGVIEWWGHRTDMPDVFAQSHVVCLPSSYGEGVPKVLIEAAACGRAIIATDAPGCREIARHGENGLLVPVKDTDALCAALIDLIDNPQRRQTMGQLGRQIAVDEFSLEQVNQATLEIYQTLLMNKGSHIPI